MSRLLRRSQSKQTEDAGHQGLPPGFPSARAAAVAVTAALPRVAVELQHQHQQPFKAARLGRGQRRNTVAAVGGVR